MPAVNSDFFQVGSSTSLAPAPQITPVTLGLFAGGSGDHNPLHLDIEAARTAGFPDVIGHGMLSMAYLGRLLTDVVEPDRIVQFTARFKAPAPVRSELACTATVIEIFEAQSRRHARLNLLATLQDGTIAVEGEAVVLVD